MICKPATALQFVQTDSDTTGNTRVISTSPHEIVGMLVTAGGGAIAVRVYNAKGAATADPLQSVLIAANAGESTPFTPAQALPFNKGIYVVFEQGGAGVGGGELTLVIN